MKTVASRCIQSCQYRTDKVLLMACKLILVYDIQLQFRIRIRVGI